jgi:feruloyl-CoA synthase
MTELVIDQLARAAERNPLAPLLPGLTNAEAWAASGAVASWLIAQGFGPGLRSLAVVADDNGSPERALLLLGALRAGAMVEIGCAGDAVLTFAARQGRLVTSNGIALAALARCSIDAAVAERRRHIDGRTPARRRGRIVQCHGDIATIAEALSLPCASPVDGGA